MVALVIQVTAIVPAPKEFSLVAEMWWVEVTPIKCREENPV